MMAGRGRPRKFDEDTAVGAAMELFWEQGYNATSCEELAERMGIGNSSFFATFKDKETLFARSFARYADSKVARAFSLLQNADSPLGGVCELLLMWRKASQSPIGHRGCLAAVSAAELDSGSEQGESVANLLHRLQKQIEKNFELARSCGEVAPDFDPKTAAAFVMVVFHGFSALERTGSSKAEMRGAIDFCLMLIGKASTRNPGSSGATGESTG